MAERTVTWPDDTSIDVTDQRPFVLDGVQFLDQHHPGWADTIDTSALDMVNVSHCILGQLWMDKHLGDFYSALRDLEITGADASRLGFDVSNEVQEWIGDHGGDNPGYIDGGDAWFYEDLANLWRDQIALKLGHNHLMYADWEVSTDA